MTKNKKNRLTALPQELQDNIFSRLPTKDTMSVYGIENRALHTSIIPFVYHTIALRWNREFPNFHFIDIRKYNSDPDPRTHSERIEAANSNPRVNLLLRTLGEVPAYGAHVKETAFYNASAFAGTLSKVLRFTPNLTLLIFHCIPPSWYTPIQLEPLYRGLLQVRNTLEELIIYYNVENARWKTLYVRNFNGMLEGRLSTFQPFPRLITLDVSLAMLFDLSVRSDSANPALLAKLLPSSLRELKLRDDWFHDLGPGRLHRWEASDLISMLRLFLGTKARNRGDAEWKLATPNLQLMTLDLEYAREDWVEGWEEYEKQEMRDFVDDYPSGESLELVVRAYCIQLLPGDF